MLCYQYVINQNFMIYGMLIDKTIFGLLID